MTEPDAPHLVTINVASVYKEPSTAEERVTQALMGARVSAAEARDGFCFVTLEDRYQGWLPQQHLRPAWDDSEYFPTSIATLFADVYPQPGGEGEQITKLSVGTRVLIAHRATVDDWVPLLLPDKTLGYVHQISLNMTHEGQVTGPDLLDQKARRAIDLSDLKRQVLAAVGTQAARVALRFIGTPYLWGGASAFGLDCSGLVQMAYKLSGIQLLRDADQQWHDRRFTRIEQGAAFGEADLAAGDLVLFSKSPSGLPPAETEERRATHIGLALGDGRFVHASGRRGGVYIDTCENEAYSTTYLGAVRASADADLAVEAA